MKKGMRMPGFTAETSLYKPRRHYDLGLSRGADGQSIQPQRQKPKIPESDCVINCLIHSNDKLGCVLRCAGIDTDNIFF